MAFTANPDKNITFSDEFNNLMSNGNMFRGDYDGAFVTYIYSAELPIAYFGAGYDSCFTIVHEFGHFMNEIYSEDVEDDEFDQSYDLLEMHSQGNELLYLCYLEENAEMTELGWTLVETHQLVNTFYIVMAGMTIDTFEQAVYLNHYDGPGSEEIMADNVITADEYDDVYAGLSEYLGIEEAYRVDDYWRNVVISSPCYYISYSISAINALQLYVKANDEGLEAAKESYLKLFTYSDVDGEMSLDEVLDYAGLLSYTEEATYRKIYAYVGRR
jgi:oligoendopeptidase F